MALFFPSHPLLTFSAFVSGERAKVSEDEVERLKKENARLRKILTENGLKDVKEEESL